MFEKRLVERRKWLNLTQQDLGAAVGCAGATVSEWERGLKRPQAKHLWPLYRALGGVLWMDTGELLKLLAEKPTR